MEIEYPSIRTVYRNGERLLRYTIPSNTYTDENLTDLNGNPPYYTLTVPKEGFRKNFSDNELWYQMKAYASKCNCKMSAIVRCLNAQKDLVAKYDTNTTLDDGTMPLQLAYGDGTINIPCEAMTRLQILNKTHIKKGDYFQVLLRDGTDTPVSGVTVKIEVSGKTYYKVTDESGIARLQVNLNEDRDYVFTAWFENPLTEIVEVDGVEQTKTTPVEVDGVSLLPSNKVSTTLRVIAPKPTLIKVYENHHICKWSKDKKTLTVYAIAGTPFKFQLMDSNNNDPVPNKTVWCTIGSNKKSLVTSYEGLARYYVDLKEGTYDVKLGFDGDDIHAKSNNTYNIKVVVQHKTSCKYAVRNTYLYDKKLKRNIYNASYNGKFFPILRENSSGKSLGIPNRTLKISYTADEGTNKGKTVTKKLTTSDDGYVSVPLNGLSKGKHTIKVAYGGDYYFSSLTKEFVVNITNNTQTKLTSMTNSICPGKDNIVVKLQTIYNEPISQQTVNMKSPYGTLSAKTNDYGSARFNIYWDDGEYDVQYLCDSMNNGFNAPTALSQKITSYGHTDYDLTLADTVDYSLMYMHLLIPEKINDETEYLEFVFYLSPESTIEKDTDGNVTSISNDSCKVYFKDFMINSGKTKAKYSETNTSMEIIDFGSSYYALLYPDRDINKGLEVIRPYRDRMSSKKVLASNRTVFAPFYMPYIKEDRPDAVCKEYLNFHFQRVNVSQE